VALLVSPVAAGATDGRTAEPATVRIEPGARVARDLLVHPR
jgi:hypothetical protein